MKKYLSILLMAFMSISLFAQETKGEDNPAAQAVMKIFEGKSWVITADRADLANSVSVDGMQPDLNYFNCSGDNINVKIDFMGARASGAVTPRKARQMAGAIRSTGNTLATLPPMYTATYSINSQEVTVDKKGRHVTAKIRYSVEDSNVSNMGATPTLEIRVNTKDMSCDVRFEGFRSGETYYGKILEKVKIK